MNNIIKSQSIQEAIKNNDELRTVNNNTQFVTKFVTTTRGSND